MSPDSIDHVWEPWPCGNWMAQAVRCPGCQSAVLPGAAFWVCANQYCDYACAGFPVVMGQPVLVDFRKSIFRRADYENSTGSVLARDDTGRALRTRLRRAILGDNPVTPRLIGKLLDAVRKDSLQPKILVVGGGAVGAGMAALYAAQDIDVVGTDVYASANTRLVADGHSLPFCAGVFDAVIVQAVLEHVLNPHQVVDEIHRVLKPNGLVYADTPFMQHVHEGAYDFTRFTRSGHRWLFRRFVELEAGTVGGAGTSLLWSIRHFFRALGAPDRLATVLTIPFVPLRWLERFARPQQNADAASGHYFLGQRAPNDVMRAGNMVAYYESQSRPQA